MLAIAASAPASAAPPAGEATLPRELRTPLLPEAHVPVGYCWQNSRCRRPVLRPQHSYIGDLVSHPAGPICRPLSVVAGEGEGGLRHQEVVAVLGATGQNSCPQLTQAYVQLGA